MIKKITIQSEGVLKCCIASIGGDYDENGEWEIFKNPQEKDLDICEYCHRKFILVNSRWEPLETFRKRNAI